MHSPLAAPRLASPLSLRLNFTWTFASNLVYAACQWGVLVVLVKLGSAELVGRHALALAIAVPFLMLANMQLRSIQVTDARCRFDFGDYLGMRLATTGLAMAAIGVVAVAGGHGSSAGLIIAIVAAAKAVEAVSDLLHGLFQRHERMDLVARSLMLKGPFSLAAFTSALALSHSLPVALVAQLTAWALVVACYDWPTARRLNGAPLRPCWRSHRVGSLLRLALPLGLVHMLIALDNSIPRYVLESELGAEALGLFAALAYLLMAGTTVVSALGQSAAPRLARLYAAGDRPGYTRLVWRLVGVGVGLAASGVAVAALAGKPILTLIYAPEYAAHAPVLVVIMAGAGFAYIASFLGYAMTAAHRFGVQVPLFAGVAAASYLGCTVLIPAWGLLGAAAALALSAFTQLLGSAVVVWHAALRTPQSTSSETT